MLKRKTNYLCNYKILGMYCIKLTCLMSAEVIEGVGDVVDVADEIAAEMTAAAACYQEVGVVIKAILNLPFIVNSL